MVQKIYGVIERVKKSEYDYIDNHLKVFFVSIDQAVIKLSNEGNDYLRLEKWKGSQWSYFGEPIFKNNIDNSVEIDSTHIHQSISQSNEQKSKTIFEVSWTNSNMIVEYFLYEGEIV